MSSEVMERLPQDANIAGWTPQQHAVMQQLGMVDRQNWKGRQPDAPLGVIEAFLGQCERTGLDPTARQIYAAEMGGKWTVLISIDGFRLIADRTKKYRGKLPTQWCGKDGVWRDIWLEDEPPAAARVAVLREDFDEPLVAVATYAGYAPRDRKTGEFKPSGQWEHNPSNQLAKCAEMLALRQAFPNELSGLYGTEEMDQARAPRQQHSAPALASQQRASRTAAPTHLTEQQWANWSERLERISSKEDGKREYSAAAQEGVLGLLNPDGVPLKELFNQRAAALKEAERTETAEVVDEVIPRSPADEPSGDSELWPDEGAVGEELI